ncbi:MAG: adenine glycosylase [Eggerthellaceae bacterium]|nr:adenine glycosylase [Eggerthellaceae bacterium]
MTLKAVPFSERERAAFIERVFAEGKRLYRDLPWRGIDDAYQVLVSEVMLQQTQVSRVLKYWEPFCALFPTIDALAAADTALVLEQWQGLGYNRRALALKRAAEICSVEYAGQLPQTSEELRTLPGVGAASAAGVLVFAHNRPAVYIETNVRTAFIHEFFPEAERVTDKELFPLVKATCSPDEPRAWYYALLDYGWHLKQVTTNPSRKSAHYAKQSAFIGSRRQKRAELLRCVLHAPDGIEVGALYAKLNAFEAREKRGAVDRATFDSLIDDLLSEGFFYLQDDTLRCS